VTGRANTERWEENKRRIRRDMKGRNAFKGAGGKVRDTWDGHTDRIRMEANEGHVG